jgi:hypothetical protein
MKILLIGYDNDSYSNWFPQGRAYITHLYARIPRVESPEHEVLHGVVPWAEARSRMSSQLNGIICILGGLSLT